MKKIVVLGAGRSATRLITWLAQQASPSLHITIADADASLLQEKTQGLSLHTVVADMADTATLTQLCAGAAVVISMLPAHMHPAVGQVCLLTGSHLVTASYVSTAMQALHAAAKEKGLIFLNECGLDPGLDHASAMELFDNVDKAGGKVTSFKSYCGGLIAPAFNDNHWGYKIAWAPQNIVNAAKDGAKYLHENQVITQGYPEVFEAAQPMKAEGLEDYEAYANRDSLPYKELYVLKDADTVYRATLRYKGFSQAWATVATCKFTSKEKTGGNCLEHLNNWLGQNKKEAHSPHYQRIAYLIDKDFLEEQGFLTAEKLASPADAFLTDLISKRWAMQPHEQDQIILYHAVGYQLNGEDYTLHSKLMHTGRDKNNTAMADTVGLPLGIAAMLLINNAPTQHAGVQIPIQPAFYQPILKGMRQLGFEFKEWQSQP